MKRFYKSVSVEQAAPGWRVALDGRGIKTQGGRPQILPTAALAEALAGEWSAQGEEMDPALFVMRDMADHALDVVAPDRQDAIARLVPFADTDTLLYRGEAGDALHARQMEIWEPMVRGAEHRWDVHFERLEGVIHRPQPAATLARMKSALEARGDMELAALTSLASLSASLIVALAAIEPQADAQALWTAANLEEDWQAELWGKDAEAQARRERRFTGFAAAMRFATLARG